MDVYLLSLGLEGDVLLYAELLGDLGIRTPDDLLLEEPTLEDLEEVGIDNARDREKIYFEIHPEKRKINPTTATFDISDLDKPIAGFDPIAYEEAKSAILQANVEKFKEAISNNFNVNMQDPLSDKNSLLHWAVTFKHPAIIQILLDKGAVQLTNAYDKIPLDLAMDAYSNGDSSYHDIVNLLVQHTQKQLGLV